MEGIKAENSFDRNFIFDVYTLITKKQKSLNEQEHKSLKRKIYDVKNREMISMF